MVSPIFLFDPNSIVSLLKKYIKKSSVLLRTSHMSVSWAMSNIRPSRRFSMALGMILIYY